LLEATGAGRKRLAAGGTERCVPLFSKSFAPAKVEAAGRVKAAAIWIGGVEEDCIRSRRRLISSGEGSVARSFLMRRYPGLFSSTLLVVLLTRAAPAHALTILDTFSGSWTSNADAAQIEAASNAIATLYSNPFTVNINFQSISSGLGESSQVLYATSYANYTRALKNDSAANPGNTTLATAVASLSKGNDAAGQTPIALTSSLIEALGLGNVSVGGAIYFNSSLMYFGLGAVPSNLYSGTGVIQHEIDEILGGRRRGNVARRRLSGLLLRLARPLPLFGSRNAELHQQHIRLGLLLDQRRHGPSRLFQPDGQWRLRRLHQHLRHSELGGMSGPYAGGFLRQHREHDAASIGYDLMGGSGSGSGSVKSISGGVSVISAPAPPGPASVWRASACWRLRAA
jgi:hypothetical protein